MTNLTIESNKQNETIDSKLNIDINNQAISLSKYIFENVKAVFKLVALIQKSACHKVFSCT